MSYYQLLKIHPAPQS